MIRDLRETIADLPPLKTWLQIGSYFIREGFLLIRPFWAAYWDAVGGDGVEIIRRRGLETITVKLGEMGDVGREITEKSWWKDHEHEPNVNIYFRPHGMMFPK